MYVPLKNYSVIRKFVLAIITGALRFVLENCVNFKWAYICSFQKRYCLNQRVLIRVKCSLEGFKDSCFENIVISTERYP